MRAVPPCHTAFAAAAALLLAGCGEEADDAADGAAGAQPSQSVTVPIDAVASPDDAPAGAPSDAATNATPMAERVATIGLLNKRNNVTRDFEMKPGESVEDGAVLIRLEACERTAPYEFPQETGAFVQVFVRERGETERRRVHSGWLFKENPSLNVVEHPIYDVWVKDCAMSFPGDE